MALTSDVLSAFHVDPSFDTSTPSMLPRPVVPRICTLNSFSLDVLRTQTAMRDALPHGACSYLRSTGFFSVYLEFLVHAAWEMIKLVSSFETPTTRTFTLASAAAQRESLTLETM
ncbi:hypothetical protein CLOM_g14563 [Closterium sp. NIES-68]|nr:hypothetical protein CLOM_g14563 [Closterium sp. NIES-68]